MTETLRIRPRAEGIDAMREALTHDAAQRGYRVSVEMFDYNFRLAAGFEDPKTIVRHKPYKRIDKVLQFLRLQPHKRGPYRKGINTPNDPNGREMIRWWVRHEVDEAELRRLERGREAGL